MKKIIYAFVISLIFFNSYAEELPSYSWEEVLYTPPLSSTEQGFQILHFKTKNKPFNLDKAAIEIVNRYFKHAKALDSDASVIRFATDVVTIIGAYIELGVCTGKTINFIAALNPTKTIFGFDSFEGLPEDWVRQDKTIKKGTFGFKNKRFVPPVLSNVKLFKGWFNESLPRFLKEVLKDTPIAFLHVDSDIYSSAQEALTIFKNNIVPGTIIVFDEFYNYPGFENHEWKAFHEFLQAAKLNAEYLAYNVNHEQVVIRIKK